MDGGIVLKNIIMKGEIMDAECPKCKSKDFDVWDEDCDIHDYYIKYDCVCNNCDHEFTIEGKMIITKVVNR